MLSVERDGPSALGAVRECWKRGVEIALCCGVVGVVGGDCFFLPRGHGDVDGGDEFVDVDLGEGDGKGKVVSEYQSHGLAVGFVAEDTDVCGMPVGVCGGGCCGLAEFWLAEAEGDQDGCGDEDDGKDEGKFKGSLAFHGCVYSR